MFATGLLSPLPSLAALCLRLACLLAAIAVGDRISFYIRELRDGGYLSRRAQHVFEISRLTICLNMNTGFCPDSFSFWNSSNGSSS